MISQAVKFVCLSVLHFCLLNQIRQQYHQHNSTQEHEHMHQPESTPSVPTSFNLRSFISKSARSLALTFTWCLRLLLSSAFPISHSLSSTFIHIYSTSLLVFVFPHVFYSFLSFFDTCLNYQDGHGVSLDTCKSFNKSYRTQSNEILKQSSASTVTVTFRLIVVVGGWSKHGDLSGSPAIGGGQPKGRKGVLKFLP